MNRLHTMSEVLLSANANPVFFIGRRVWLTLRVYMCICVCVCARACVCLRLIYVWFYKLCF